MSRWGIGPKFGILTSLYSLIIYMIQNNFCQNFEYTGLKIFGFILILIGVCLFIYPAITIDKYINEGRLRTKGFYSYCRHPIYATWILIIIPGMILYWGAIIGLTIPIVAYFIFKKYIHIEEDYLLKMFGLEYRNYMDRVNAVFTKLF